MAELGEVIRNAALASILTFTGAAAIPQTAQAQTRAPSGAAAQTVSPDVQKALTALVLLESEKAARGSNAPEDRQITALITQHTNTIRESFKGKSETEIATLVTLEATWAEQKNAYFTQNPIKAYDALKKVGIQNPTFGRAEAMAAEQEAVPAKVTTEQQKQYNALLALYIERDESNGEDRKRLEPQIRDQEYALREQGSAGIELVKKARAEAKKIHEEQENAERRNTPAAPASQPGVPVQDSGIVLRNGATVDLGGKDTAHTIIITRGTRATIKRMGPEDKLLCPEGTTTLTYSGTPGSGTPGNPTVVRARDAQGTVLAEINVVGAYASTENRNTSRQTYSRADASRIIDNISRGSGRGILNDIGEAIGATNKTTSTNGTRTAASLDQILNSFGVHGSLESLAPIPEDTFKQQQQQAPKKISYSDIRKEMQEQRASWGAYVNNTVAGRETPKGGPARG